MQWVASENIGAVRRVSEQSLCHGPYALDLETVGDDPLGVEATGRVVTGGTRHRSDMRRMSSSARTFRIAPPPLMGMRVRQAVNIPSGYAVLCRPDPAA